MASDLSKEAADLVQHGREALRPTAADKARVLSALRGQLPPPAPPAKAIGGAGLGGKGLLMAGGAAVAVVGIALYAMLPAGETQVITQGVNVPSTEAIDVDDPVESVVVPASPTPARPAMASTTTPVTSVTSSRGTAGDRLAEEVALLTRAQREFHGGNLSAALASVDEHRRKFARGTLGQERVKLRVKILCALGRTSEAKTEHHKLDRLSPGQVGSDDVCGGK